MPPPVIHHIEVCVKDLHESLQIFQTYGFLPFAKRETDACKQIAARLNSIVFIITQKTNGFKSQNKSIKKENFLVLCSHCENKNSSDDDDDDHVDTVFNVALNVKNVVSLVNRIQKYDENCVIHPPTVAEDINGQVTVSVIKSTCGNVIHTLLNTEKYHGLFLPGFIELCDGYDDVSNYYDAYRMKMTETINKNVTHVDHVTLACRTGHSENIIKWYKNAFGMENFKISRDEKDDGLILEQGVGLRLRAMEYWLCSETGLIFSNLSESHPNKERSPHSLMLVIVESLPGQRNCNIESFLQNHRQPGIEHIALSALNINYVVDNLKLMGVKFRKPPDLYYNELKLNKIDKLVNMDEIQRLGVLVDREDNDGDEDGNPKILMQIFTEPLFSTKTCFIEIIQRFGATGLGSGNVIALLKSIREAERRKAIEENESLTTKEDRTHSRIC